MWNGSNTTWNGVIPGPFYRGIPLLTAVYRGKPLSFSTRGFLKYYTCTTVNATILSLSLAPANTVSDKCIEWEREITHVYTNSIVSYSYSSRCMVQAFL